LVVEVRTDEPEQRFAVGARLGVRSPGGKPVAPTAGPPAVLTVQAVRRHGARLVVRFEGIADRSGAESLRGAVLTVDLTDLPPAADPDEFYDHQLVGLAVALVDGQALGTVADVLHGPGGDLLVVAREGAGDVLVPFVHQIVPTVDVTAGRIVVDPPEGLLDQR
jgi:16S rRNA processing protein RimM